MISWNCDFCNKSGLITSKAGIIYCPNCHMSYGEKINEPKEEKNEKI